MKRAAARGDRCSFDYVLQFVAPCKGMAAGNTPKQKPERKKPNDRDKRTDQKAEARKLEQGGKRRSVTQAGPSPAGKRVANAP
jgi:hypothetical protein